MRAKITDRTSFQEEGRSYETRLLRRRSRVSVPFRQAQGSPSRILQVSTGVADHESHQRHTGSGARWTVRLGLPRRLLTPRVDSGDAPDGGAALSCLPSLPVATRARIRDLRGGLGDGE